MDPKQGLLIALGIFTLYFIGMLAQHITSSQAAGRGVKWPGPILVVAGFIINFFDALGIGSFATTTAYFRAGKVVDDAQIPGTLNVGHTLPTIAQAFIFTTLVPVEAQTLILMIIAAVAGSYIGAGLVSGWPKRTVQTVMGFAMLGAAILIIMRLTDSNPEAGVALGLSGTKLIIGMVGNFALGALMTMGIGLYAPCMILIYFLGMDPTAAFPIMMGSCAFLMPVASAKFVKTGAFNLTAALGLAIGGVFGSVVAGLAVESMDLDTVRYLVVVVVLYTAYGLLSSARKEAGAGAIPS